MNTEREVTDGENVRWKCIQAFAGTNGKAAQEAVELAANGVEVEVICTPTGGAQTVRLKLDKDWADRLSDEELVRKIESGKS